MIVFTDGLANEGETNAEALVGKYREAQKELSRFIPLSAFTIGGYDPYLLNKVGVQHST